jgi:hypothetical protein
MSRRSKNNRRKNTAAGETPSSEVSGAGSQTNGCFYPLESHSMRQKMLLTVPITMELIWLAYLICLVVIK